MGRLTLILGGARSGKSTFAERLASQNEARVAYIATAQAMDDEMTQRIEAHRSQRPASWLTLEIPDGVGQALRSNPPEVDVIVLDCRTLLVSNLLLGVKARPGEQGESRSFGKDRSDDENLSDSESSVSAEYSFDDERAALIAVEQELDELLEAIRNSPAEWIVVSNEVGMGLVPPYPLGRVYRDLLGWANQRLAGTADLVYFMIAGIPMRLNPES